jgi:gamma-glutamyl-gamma-aminobutyrate hydrolase PuuD
VASNGSDAPLARPPRIGLPTYVEHATWGPWDRSAALLPAAYVDCVVRAGGLPVLLAPVDLPGAAEAAVEALDGLLLTGGADLDPGVYGAERDPETKGLRPDRDRWDQALLAAALARDLPVLAVCRGLQVLDVALGGTLHQHVPDVVGHEGHRPVPGTYGTTHVTLEPGSLVATALGEELDVPCHHHQAVDRVADALTAVGRADDGLVEAVEMPGRSFVVGVQWHPEDSDDQRLFEALVAAAR